jgi:hypothetical protein
LFGSFTQVSRHYLDAHFSFNWETENPFALFLRNLAVPFGDVAEFKNWSGEWTPEYHVCPDEAAALVGGDHDRAEEILNGFVALSDMPKDIRKADMAKERAEWVRSKAEEYHEELLNEMAGLR